MIGILKKVELLANIAIIIVAILLASILIKSYLWRSNPVQSNSRAAMASQQQIEIGEKINLPDIDWQKNGKTLLLAVSTTCHFCTESGPFYQHIVKEHGDTQLVALVPQQVDEGRQYLKKLGVEIDQIRQIQFNSLGVQGTPTLLLINSEGVVENLWLGRLRGDQETEVLSELKKAP